MGARLSNKNATQVAEVKTSQVILEPSFQFFDVSKSAFQLIEYNTEIFMLLSIGFGNALKNCFHSLNVTP